jgi:hypothetical protein
MLGNLLKFVRDAIKELANLVKGCVDYVHAKFCAFLDLW